MRTVDANGASTSPLPTGERCHRHNAPPGRPSMLPHLIIVIALLAGLLPTTPAAAQIPPGSAPQIMPPPPAPPPPRIEVPVVPQLDSPPPNPAARLERRGSFGKRVVQCLDAAAAAGLDPAERATYSRACANR